MKKFKIIAGWVLTLALLTGTLSFVSKKQETVPCRYINIYILDSLQHGFVTKNDIRKILDRNNPNMLGSPLSMINTKHLEEEILKNKAIKICNAYSSPDGSLFVEITQRQPILRIINSDQKSYYIDNEGYLIPFSTIQTPNVLVATGNIKENFNPDLIKYNHVSQFNVTKKRNILSDLYEFANFINSDLFWKSQFEQVYVNKKEELELIPRVGAHIIILGNTDDYENKLSKLMTLYNKGLNNIGWNEYETINLKYKNQVICSKR